MMISSSDVAALSRLSTSTAGPDVNGLVDMTVILPFLGAGDDLEESVAGA